MADDNSRQNLHGVVMLLRKQPPPPTPDADHAEYYVDPDGQPHFVVGATDTVVHDGEPVILTEGGDPTTIDGKVQLYTKDMGGITELFSRNGAGDVAQITSAGALNTPPGINTFFANAEVSTAFDFVATGSPVQGVILYDLGQTLTVPLATWVTMQQRISIQATGVPFPYAIDTSVTRFAMLLSDGPGDFTVRFAVFGGSNYAGPLGGGYFVMPYYLIPAAMLLDASFPVLADDAAVFLMGVGPGTVARVTGYVDAIAITIPPI